jgi:hypothetical protein
MMPEEKAKTVERSPSGSFQQGFAAVIREFAIVLVPDQLQAAVEGRASPKGNSR